MLKKNKHQIFIIFLCILFCFSLYRFMVYQFQIRLTPYEEQKFFSRTGVIVVKGKQEHTPTKTTLYRLRDAVPQEIIDDMNFMFVDDSEVVFIPKEFTSSSRIFFVDERFVKFLSVGTLPGPVHTVTQSPSTSYVLIKGNRPVDNTPYFCVTEKSPEAILPEHDCTFIAKRFFPNEDPSSFSLFWNPKEERELLILNQNSEKLYTFDPWEEGPQEITDPNVLKVKKHYIESSKNPLRHISKFGPFLFSKQDGRTTWKFVPFSSTFFLADTAHILVQYKKDLYIFDASLQQKSFFVTLPYKNAEIFTFYTQ